MSRPGPAIIDAHHHLWDPARRDYPWMAPEALAPLRRAYAAADLIPELERCGVVATVVVQAVSSVEETEELLDIARTSKVVAGVVGWIDLRAGDVAAGLDRLTARPGGERLVGIRHQVHDEADAGWLLDASVRRGLRAVADADLVYDLLVRARELPAARRIATVLPELRLVLDHAAKPAIATAGWDPWAAEVAALAECGNVSCKLSGLVTEADWASWSTEQLRPYVEWVIGHFGPDRVLFGSDWPVCTLAAGYAEVVEAIESLTADLDDGARARLFGENARRIYRLAPLPPDPAR